MDNDRDVIIIQDSDAEDENQQHPMDIDHDVIIIQDTDEEDENQEVQNIDDDYSNSDPVEFVGFDMPLSPDFGNISFDDDTDNESVDSSYLTQSQFEIFHYG